MEKKEGDVGTHILVVPYPSQGHINPMLHLSKRLASKGARVTLATTRFIITTMLPNQSHPPDHPVRLEIISDGYDEGGFSQAGDVGQYLERLESVGSKTLTELIKKYENSNDSIDCVIYDAFLPWALDVAKGLGIVGAAFFTQACVVNYVYYCLHHGVLKIPVTPPVALPGLPELFQLEDMPSFVYVSGSYPSYFNMVLSQFSNVHKADCVLVNTFYELEKQVVDTMSKVCPSLLTIGPTIPSVYTWTIASTTTQITASISSLVTLSLIPALFGSQPNLKLPSFTSPSGAWLAYAPSRWRRSHLPCKHPIPISCGSSGLPRTPKSRKGFGKRQRVKGCW